MSREEFELNIAQVESVISSCRSSFRSKRQQAIYNNLIILFESIKSKYTSFDFRQLLFCKFILHRVYIGIEFLNYESASNIPIQLIACLDLVMEDWIDNPNFFSIVFSHNSSALNEFHTWALNENDIASINRTCHKINLGATYDHGLIHISQPRFFNNDFLSNIPTYHEIGHFVEANYMISTNIIQDSTFIYQDSTSLNKLKLSVKNDRIQLSSYLSEHFADIFAAQYLGNAMIENLNFVAMNGQPGPEHPSTNKRLKVISAFLTGSGDKEDLDIVERLKKATEIQTKRKHKQRELKDRRIPLSVDPFVTDKAAQLNNKNEVYDLVVRGWENFMSHTAFSRKYQNPTERNYRINKLIKKTIDITFINQNFISRIATKLSALFSN
ncbi:MAG: hypothetical protein DRI84_04925 [Bacteroidetes bacterium]|nr:MAG: hypothetical protein DRI84_04925 [Bacteroidota bacterium]